MVRQRAAPLVRAPARPLPLVQRVDPAALPGRRAGHGLLVAGCVWKFGLSADAAVASFFCAALVAVSATDLEHRIVPNRVVVPAAAIVLLAQTALHPSVEWPSRASAPRLFLFAAALAYPSGMGMGDVKLALLLGAMLGADGSDRA